MQWPHSDNLNCTHIDNTPCRSKRLEIILLIKQVLKLNVKFKMYWFFWTIKIDVRHIIYAIGYSISAENLLIGENYFRKCSHQELTYL